MDYSILDWLAGWGPCGSFLKTNMNFVLLKNDLHALKHEINKYNIVVNYEPPHLNQHGKC
jgi:hypothetical protein